MTARAASKGNEAQKQDYRADTGQRTVPLKTLAVKRVRPRAGQVRGEAELMTENDLQDLVRSLTFLVFALVLLFGMFGIDIRPKIDKILEENR